MGWDRTGASLTTEDVSNASETIKKISGDITDTMKEVSETMTILTGQSEGGVITQTDTAVKQLDALCETLVKCILEIGLKIGDYLMAMIRHDQEAAETLRNSIESRVN